MHRLVVGLSAALAVILGVVVIEFGQIKSLEQSNQEISHQLSEARGQLMSPSFKDLETQDVANMALVVYKVYRDDLFDWALQKFARVSSGFEADLHPPMRGSFEFKDAPLNQQERTLLDYITTVGQTKDAEYRDQAVRQVKRLERNLSTQSTPATADLIFLNQLKSRLGMT